jgi:hypothetical protein
MHTAFDTAFIHPIDGFIQVSSGLQCGINRQTGRQVATDKGQAKERWLQWSCDTSQFDFPELEVAWSGATVLLETRLFT